MTTYRIAEAAELLGVSDDTMRRWVEAGRVASTKADGRTVVPGVDLAALAESLADQPDREATRAAAVSARNRLSGIVTKVKKDTVMAQVELICGPYRMVSLMSSEAAEELGLEPGVRAIASVKSTNVVVERPVKLKSLLVLPAALALVLPLAACGSDSDDSSAGGGGTTTLTVYAAASLTATFEEIGKKFEAEHDGVKVEFDFGGSSDLVTQIQEGAPADVFASADTANMDKLEDADLAGDDPQDFATNTLEIATPPDNPAGVANFQDLAKKGLQLVICAPEVPCGAATQTMADNLGVTLKPVSEEQSVTDVLAKVTSGEADAGVVYVTDVTAAGDAVTGVTFPESGDVVNTYPIAPVEGTDAEDLADDFVEFVLGDTGQQVLQDAGFGQP